MSRKKWILLPLGALRSKIPSEEPGRGDAAIARKEAPGKHRAMAQGTTQSHRYKGTEPQSQHTRFVVQPSQQQVL